MPVKGDIIYLYVCECLHACVLTMHMPYLCRAEEEIGSLVTGVMNSHESVAYRGFEQTLGSFS